MLQRLVVLSVAFCSLPAFAGELHVVLDLKQVVEQVALEPCAGDDCDQRALALVQHPLVLERLRGVMPRQELVVRDRVDKYGRPIVDDNQWEPIGEDWEGGLEPTGIQGSLALDEVTYERGEVGVDIDGCSLSFLVAIVPFYKGGRFQGVEVVLEVFGECGCESPDPQALKSFTVTKRDQFFLSDEGGEYLSLFRSGRAFRCDVITTCGCAVEAAPPDAMPPQDTVPPAASTAHQGTFFFFPKDVVGRALEADACSTRGEPCDPAARSAIQEALEEVFYALPGPQTVAFPYHDDGEFREFENSIGEKIVDPGEDVLSGLKAAMAARGVGEDGWLRQVGTVETACGEVEYHWLGRLREEATESTLWRQSGDDVLVFEAMIFLLGSCHCAPVDGHPLGSFFYVAELAQSVGFGMSPAGDWRAFIKAVEPISFNCDLKVECCSADEEAGDAFPGAETYVLSWDSPVWCTYGGGTITLLPPGLQPPSTTLVPSPIAPEGWPIPPGPGGPTPQDGPPAPPPVEGSGPPTAPPGTRPPILGVPPGEDEPSEEPPVPAGPPEPPAEGGKEETPPVELHFKATTKALAQGATAQGARALVQLDTGEPDLVAGDPGAVRDDSGAGQGELSAMTDEDGNATLLVPAEVAAAIGTTELALEISASRGTVLGFDGTVDPAAVLPAELLGYVSPPFTLAGKTFIPLLVPEASADALDPAIAEAGATTVEPDVCIDPMPLSDPFFGTQGSWEQPYPDQWAVQRVGFADGESSAWNLLRQGSERVTIAVIDSGLDWNHKEIDWEILWRNRDEIPGNGLDDDANGYVDDTIGWDFWDDDRTPWDHDGHGTFVAGILFADPDNGEGIAGIARSADLMVLKVMNSFGHTRASSVARAILYAVDNGARVINLSLGGPGRSTVVDAAINYAYEHEVVVVAAAGNEAEPAESQSVASVPNALTVAATGFDDRRSIYSNYGPGIDIAAPGDDVLSLRARRTDLLKNILDVEYEPESAFVGEDRRYYRASGTSFATPIVSGVAALVLANRPELGAEEVMRILKESARDVETPGVDHFTGYGVVDAVAALEADPSFYVDARIAGVGVVQRDGEQLLTVDGSALADRFRRATISIGPGQEPADWEEVAVLDRPVADGEVAAIPATRFAGSKVWILRLEVEHENGRRREFRFRLDLGGG